MSRSISDDAVMDLVFDIVVKLAMDKFEDIHVDAHNVTQFAANLMELIEKFPIRGDEKKKVVLRVLERFADREYKLADIENTDHIDQLKFVIIEVIPFAIDTICDVSKHKIVVDSVAKTRKWCCGPREQTKEEQLEELIAAHKK